MGIDIEEPFLHSYLNLFCVHFYNFTVGYGSENLK